MKILLAILAAFALSATAADAPSEPMDLVGYATSDIGSPMFLTTWPDSPAAVYNVKCGGDWRFIVSTRPMYKDGDLFGCYRFTKPQEITIVWNSRGTPYKVILTADTFTYTRWFLKLHPELEPADGAPDAGDDSDTKPDAKL